MTVLKSDVISTTLSYSNNNNACLQRVLQVAGGEQLLGLLIPVFFCIEDEENETWYFNTLLSLPLQSLAGILKKLV